VAAGGAGHRVRRHRRVMAEPGRLGGTFARRPGHVEVSTADDDPARRPRRRRHRGGRPQHRAASGPPGCVGRGERTARRGWAAGRHDRRDQSAFRGQQGDSSTSTGPAAPPSRPRRSVDGCRRRWSCRTPLGRADLREQVRRVSAFYAVRPAGSSASSRGLGLRPGGLGVLPDVFLAPAARASPRCGSAPWTRVRVNPDIDVEVAQDILFGPLIFRLLSGHARSPRSSPVRWRTPRCTACSRPSLSRAHRLHPRPLNHERSRSRDLDGRSAVAVSGGAADAAGGVARALNEVAQRVEGAQASSSRVTSSAPAVCSSRSAGWCRGCVTTEAPSRLRPAHTPRRSDLSRRRGRVVGHSRTVWAIFSLLSPALPGTGGVAAEVLRVQRRAVQRAVRKPRPERRKRHQAHAELGEQQG